MFRKVPDYYQNVVLLRRIIGIWNQMEEYLSKEGMEEPGAEIIDPLCRTWHLNTLRFPKFSTLKRDWQKHQRYLQKASEEYQQDPIYEWNLDGYEKDICGMHIHRHHIWPNIVSQLKDTNPQEYERLGQRHQPTMNQNLIGRRVQLVQAVEGDNDHQSPLLTILSPLLTILLPLLIIFSNPA